MCDMNLGEPWLTQAMVSHVNARQREKKSAQPCDGELPHIELSRQQPATIGANLVCKVLCNSGG